MKFVKAKHFVAAAALVSGSAQAQLHQAMLISDMIHRRSTQARPAVDTHEVCQRITADRSRLSQIELIERNERSIMADNQMSLRLSRPNAKLTRSVADSKRKSEALISRLEENAKPLRVIVTNPRAQACSRNPRIGSLQAPRH